MKKLIALLGVLCIGISAYSTPSAELIHTRVQRQAAAQQIPVTLSHFVTSELQAYYGQENFEDVQQTTGWYRVHRFLTWLKTNEKSLEKSTFRFYDLGSGFVPKVYTSTVAEFLQTASTASPDLWRGFWTYLGVRYLSEVYQTEFNFSQLTLIGTKTEFSSVQFGGIVINTQEPMALPEFINMGMHEGTHYLPLLTDLSASPLNELAAFYTEYNFALPVKQEDIRLFADGTRDIRRMHRFLPQQPIYREYNSFIIGLLLNPQLTPATALSLHGSIHPDLSLWETVLSLWAAEQNRFLVYQQLQSGQVEHRIEVTSSNIEDVAARFGFSRDDIFAWIANPATIVDLGDLYWPGNTEQKETVVLQKTKEKFIFVGQFKRVNKKEFMKLYTGPFSETPQLETFYHRLTEALPKNIKQTLLERWPVIVEDHYTAAMVQTLVVPYEQEWNNAIIKALNGAPPELPLPEGYL